MICITFHRVSLGGITRVTREARKLRRAACGR